MKIAIPVWRDAVSTVFDFSAQLLLVELNGNQEVGRTEVALGPEHPEKRVQELGRLRVDVLICGAVSRPLAELMKGYGIGIIPFTRGNVDDVISAYLAHQLSQPRFRLPGCRQRQ